MDPHSRAPKDTSYGNEVLSQDTMHLIQRSCYQRGSPCQDPAGNRTTRRPSGIDISPVHQVWLRPSCKAQWMGEEDNADRNRGGKATSGNGQAWISASPRGQWRTGKSGENWLQNHLWRPNDPRGWGIDDDVRYRLEHAQERRCSVHVLDWTMFKRLPSYSDVVT